MVLRILPTCALPRTGGLGRLAGRLTSIAGLTSGRVGDIGTRTRASNCLEASKIDVVSRAELAQCSHWVQAFADQRKDRRHFELVEDTLHPHFEYRYLVVTDRSGACTVQPFFIVDQDLLAGMGPGIQVASNVVRRLWPRFLTLRTLMVGCVVGEGHLDGVEANPAHLRALAPGIVRHARKLKARLIVLKEFPARYRGALQCFLDNRYTRVPSFPMTRLNVDYDSFEQYMTVALSRRTRRDLRLKFIAAERGAKIELSIVGDITPMVDEVYPLYLQVYRRSKYQFEQLTKEYLCGLGRAMPDKVRFFVWRRHGRVVAFTLCMIHEDSLYAEYIGLDYAVALDLHLYHYAIRDMVTWAIDNRLKWFCSSGLNYDPKFHLRSVLDPLDLYVRHTSPIANAVMKRLLPWITPVRFDATLKRFPNYHEIWAGGASNPDPRNPGSRAAPAVTPPSPLAQGVANE